MASSGTYSFSPDVGETIEESFERCGIDPATLTGRHMRSARRSFNYLFTEWANDGIHLWAVEQVTLALVASTATYNCGTGTVAILEMVVRRSGVDTPVNPMGRDEYLAIPNKTAEGLPNRFYLNRDVATPTLTFWNVPENATDTIIYYRMRQLQDITASTETPDAPARWQEAIAAGLSAKLAEKYAPDREQALRSKAAAQLKLAKQEDRQRMPTATRVQYSTNLRRR